MPIGMLLTRVLFALVLELERRDHDIHQLRFFPHCSEERFENSPTLPMKPGVRYALTITLTMIPFLRCTRAPTFSIPIASDSGFRRHALVQIVEQGCRCECSLKPVPPVPANIRSHRQLAQTSLNKRRRRLCSRPLALSTMRRRHHLPPRACFLWVRPLIYIPAPRQNRRNGAQIFRLKIWIRIHKMRVEVDNLNTISKHVDVPLFSCLDYVRTSWLPW